MSSEQKKKSSIVHKPFATGQVNLFNPPKSHPNGRLASARLFAKDRKTQKKESYLNLFREETATQDVSHYSLSKTTITAIAIILFANILSIIIIFNQRQQNTILDSNSIEQKPLSIIGNTNLSAKEFIELNPENLSNIPQTTNQIKKVEPTVEKNEPKPLEPLAIPPVNLTNNSSETFPQYYYVLTEYTGDRSLDLARQKVKNVSLVTLPQGSFIYMGAFSERDSAQQFLNQLKKEGFDAYIYPLDTK